jgi:general secretion pathway protein D
MLDCKTGQEIARVGSGEFMRRWGKIAVCLGIALLAAGCPKGQKDYDAGQKANDLADFDDAYAYYQKALKTDPNNASYRIKVDQARFDAGQMHLQRGYAQKKRGDLQAALGEFQRALFIDPASSVAEQEIKRTTDQIAENSAVAEAAAQPEPEMGGAPLASRPPELKPLSNAPITMSYSNEAKMVYDTIGKLAGLTVIYDPDFVAKQVKGQLNNVTLQQALDIVSLQAKAFWKPVTENIIFVIPDQPQKRRDYEEEVVKTFYLGNTVQPQDITEIVTGLRQLLDMKRLQQLNSQNAIIARDTPDKLALAEKMIRDIDKAKPEVLIQVEVVQARTDRMRALGILPGQTASAAIVPATTTSTTTGTSTATTSTPGTITLSQLKNLTNADVVLTIPSITANAVLTDTYTKIIQNPEIRSIDGQPAKLRVGDKVPVATGSFQAGVGVGTTGAAGVVNPLVNTQFQYLDVGVNVDITPRVHPNHEISMKVKVEVSSVTGTSTIGGIQQPIISQRTIEHDIRLKEGEVSVLGGLFEKDDSRTLNGWPGLAKIPFLRYFFSEDSTDKQDNEVLIVLTPRIVRMPEWTKANLQTMYSGTETNVQVRRDAEIRAPLTQAATQGPAAAQGPLVNPGGAPGAASPVGNAGQPGNSGAGQASGAPARLKFEPQSVALKVGQEATVAIAVDNVSDLFSIPLLLQFNPAVISIEEVQQAVGQGGTGGFLSGGGTQTIAVVDRIDKDRGQAVISATRQPNTAGVSGSGTLVAVKIKALAPGLSSLSIVQVNAKDSQQRLIPLITGEATVQVQP